MFRHVVLPVVSSVALVLVGLLLAQPAARPRRSTSRQPIVLVWLGIGIVVLVVRLAREGSGWLHHADTTADPADPLVARGAV